MIGVFSKGMLKIPNLAAFLGADVVRPGRDARGLSAVAVWGRRPSAAGGEEFARRHGLPLLRVEDGFLRSLDLGCNGAAPMSLTVDGRGVYYDAGSPSDLEDLLEHGEIGAETLSAARKALGEVVESCLSKYNHAPLAPPALLGDGARPRVLLLDQTLGDMSVGLGGADAGSFLSMAEAARSYFPGARLFVKTHPDVIAGRKRGYLTDRHLARGVTIIDKDYAPLSLLAQADAVFTVTSQMGFEALLLDKEVHCFGLPFYAGWGATRDSLRCPRRSRARSPLEIFAAAYLMFARYVNPVTGLRCGVDEAVRLLSTQRSKNERNRGGASCLHFDRWKRPHARAFLSATEGKVRFYGAAESAVREASAGGVARVVAWSSREEPGLEASCRRAGTPLVRMEDGFLRSVGLGSDYHCPYSLVLDDEGIYYDPTGPSRLETILRTTDFPPGLLARAVRLRERIVGLGVTKYNVGNTAFAGKLPEGRRVALVPGQVEDDASVLRGGGGLTTNLDLLAEVRRAHPDRFIVYKPHPDVERGNRKGKVHDPVGSGLADQVLNGVSMHGLLELVHEVHTLTSLTGFEALLRGVEVHTYGGPFYAGWGLTTDRLAFPRRGRRLGLDALVAGTLILYPDYYDWDTSVFCGPEEICALLARSSRGRSGKSWVRAVRGLRDVWKSLTG